MKKSEIVSKFVLTANKLAFAAKKKSPEIFLIFGVVGAVGTTVLACHETTKIDVILNRTHENVGKIHEALADPTLKEQYTEEDSKKDLVITYAHAGLSLVKLYGPSVILGALSITSILASHNILRKRNVALSAAYATLDNSFKKYRKNVVERFGEKVDHELQYGIKAQKFDETTTDAKGKQKTVKKTVEVADPYLASPYAVYFTKETANGCETNSDYNMMFLKAQQTYANDLLRARGHIFLNEVYDAIGMKERVVAGQVVGWIYNENNPTGDNCVDLRAEIVNRELSGGGYEEVIVLNPNVDGDILNNPSLGLADL